MATKTPAKGGKNQPMTTRYYKVVMPTEWLPGLMLTRSPLATITETPADRILPEPKPEEPTVEEEAKDILGDIF